MLVFCSFVSLILRSLNENGVLAGLPKCGVGAAVLSSQLWFSLLAARLYWILTIVHHSGRFEMHLVWESKFYFVFYYNEPVF